MTPENRPAIRVHVKREDLESGAFPVFDRMGNPRCYVAEVSSGGMTHLEVFDRDGLRPVHGMRLRPIMTADVSRWIRELRSEAEAQRVAQEAAESRARNLAETETLEKIRAEEERKTLDASKLQQDARQPYLTSSLAKNSSAIDVAVVCCDDGGRAIPNLNSVLAEAVNGPASSGAVAISGCFTSEYYSDGLALALANGSVEKTLDLDVSRHVDGLLCVAFTMRVEPSSLQTNGVAVWLDGTLRLRDAKTGTEVGQLVVVNLVRGISNSKERALGNALEELRELVRKKGWNWAALR